MVKIKNFKVVIFAVFLLYSQTSSPNYFFKQLAFSSLVGAVPAYLFKRDCSGSKTMVIGASYIFLKFFYDVLTAKTLGEGIKGCISVPLNAGVVAGSYFICDEICR